MIWALFVGGIFDQTLGCSIRVPLDYSSRRAGNASIYYELGADFDSKKPTVLIIADGQQFYVRKGKVAGIQEAEFGPQFNVVGIVGRADCPDAVKACKNSAGTVNWKRAYEFYRAAQWVEDIDTIRRRVVGADGKVCLFGQSGGAFLVHQYLAAHGRFVTRAVTPAAVMPFWQGRLGLRSDRFWDEISPASRMEIMNALRHYAAKRDIVVQAIQRQNFFVPTAGIDAARAALIHELALGNDEALAKAVKDYQVDAIQNFLKSDTAIPIRVRLFEFQVSAHEDRLLKPDVVYPDLENTRDIAGPVTELLTTGQIAEPAYNFQAAHALETDVLVISGARDHTVDYRTSIALAAAYPRGSLQLLDDDHELANLGAKLRNRLVVSFLLGGPESKAYQSALSSAKAFVFTDGTR